MTLKNILLNNGATINKTGEIHKKRGYQVSKKDLMIIPVYKMRKKALLELIQTLKEKECLGIWIDSKKAYIDISEYKSNLNTALSLGKKRHQISIFDWSTKECIYC